MASRMGARRSRSCEDDRNIVAVSAREQKRKKRKTKKRNNTNKKRGATFWQALYTAMQYRSEPIEAAVLIEFGICSVGVIKDKELEGDRKATKNKTTTTAGGP